MNSEFRGLTAGNTDNEDEDMPPLFTSLSNDPEKPKWSHIDDLDAFFTRVYQYHQNHGLPSLVLMELLNLFQILFLAFFSVFLVDCVNYERLFASQSVVDGKHNDTIVKKRTLGDVVFPASQCVQRITFSSWVCLIVVIVFWAFRLIKAIYNIVQYAEIKAFYATALGIETRDLPNITWHEVQEKLLHIQRKHHLCIHKQELTELDIYNRILRFKNYEVAMVNQGLLPPRLTVPLFGELITFTTGFKYNFEFAFFWGPFAPFSSSYQLRPEFKVFSKRGDLTSEISKTLLLLGVFNLVLAPVIFVWQLLQFFYSYAELIKRDPSMLGIRRWSNYGKLYLRHFNELEHELEARLSRAYRPATLYLNSFVSRSVVVVAKCAMFTFGAVFAVLLALTVYDEDVINVEHVLTILTVSGAVAGVARSLIPDETMVYFMDQMMYQILAQIHYMPDGWKINADSYAVRDDFSKIFQYKFVYLIEELLSPFVTPFVILFWLRPRSAKFVDFLRNFTIDVVGVGDVCSFAQMDTRRHGNPKWLSKTTARKSHQAHNGKTELSLIHFAHTNPHWRMPTDASAFIDQLKDQALGDIAEVDSTLASSSHSSKQPIISMHPQQQQQAATNNPSLTRSLYHLQSLVYNSTITRSNMMSTSMFSTSQVHPQPGPAVVEPGQAPRGAVSRVEGPLFSTSKHERQTLLALAQASNLQLSMTQTLLPLPAGLTQTSLSAAPSNITTALENSLDMCFSALYMHELHRKYNHGDYIDLDRVKEEESDEFFDSGGGDDGASTNINLGQINQRYNSFGDDDDEPAPGATGGAAPTNDDSDSDNHYNPNTSTRSTNNSNGKNFKNLSIEV